MKYPAYPKYKPSGVEWLGEVPEHWVVLRSDAILDTERKQVPTEVFTGKEVFHYSIPAIQEFGTGIVENGEEVESAKQAITEPVVLVSRLNPRKATICRAVPKEQITIASTEFVALKSTKCHLRFLEYLVSSENFRQRLDSWVQSVTRSHQRVSPEHIYRFWSAWPDVSEQRAIADFLDRETAKLDTLVAKKRELLEKLKEKRTALISRTVTRGLPPEAARAAGLDPQPKLKPSGIEWLGEVPEHWEVKMIKRIWSLCEYGISESLSGDGAIKVLTMGNIQEGRVIIPEDGCLETVPETMLLKKNDLLFNRTNSLVHVGKVGLFDGDENLQVTFASYLVRIRASAQVSPQFLAYYLNIPQLLDFARSLALPSINQANLNPTRYGQIKVAIPTIEEQRALADYLDHETAKIDRMTAKVEEAIARLQEYRTALITAAVTGKIEVRNESSEVGLAH